MQIAHNPTGPEDRLFSGIAAAWLSAGLPGWKASTAARYRSLLALYLLPAFGSREAAALTRSECLAFAQSLPAERGLSPGTAAMVLTVLKNILQYAAQTLDMPVPDLRGITIRKPQRSLRVFSPGEQRRLCQHLLKRRDLPSLGIVLALYTGLRVGELCALRWEDIAPGEGVLRVRHTLQRLPAQEGPQKTAILITEPKSPSSLRTIPIPAGLLPLLRERQAAPDCFFLTGTTQYIEPRSMENRLNAALRDCGMPPSGFHICRHSFATRCVELGFDTKTLSEILGHASVSITMNRYVHPSMDFKRENMNRLDALLNIL